ncbi:MAG: hypothetical protein JRI68_15915 [Deltaproteobacteria bacterium]|nr:hypothetical protein [Deltaproteobacteria bacterium]
MVPSLESFTPKERRVIRAHRTPLQVQRYFNALPYNDEAGRGTLRSFRGVVASGRAHCLEAALSAAVILEQHGYPVQLLDLESWDSLDHVLFLYRKQGRWGTVARSRDPGLHGRKPVFKTLRELVDSYFEPYVDLTGRIIGYGVTDLKKLGRYDWRLSKRNVWKVEQHLRDMPHRRFHGADRRYRSWHERYQAYKRRFPDRKPLYYDNRRTWAVGYPKGTP